MTIEFTPLTVLIGGNSCGKSTVLQALDFLRSAATRDIPEYLRERGWTFSELKTINTVKQPIELISVFELQGEKETRLIEWFMKIDNTDGAYQIDEKFTELNTNVNLLPSDATERKVYVESSLLKLIHIPTDVRKELLALKKFLMGLNFYGVLSPEKMRLGTNYEDKVDNIGVEGSTLTAFINRLTQEEHKYLDNMLSKFLGYELSVSAVDTSKNIVLYVTEHQIENNNHKFLAIPVSQISDGLLRLIAFVAISIKKSNCGGMFLFDEIEDGINPYLTEKVIGLLRDIIKESGQQIIVTTHSPVMVDDINPEELIFLWKDDAGAVQGKKMFDTEKMRESLEFLMPGEIWVNYGKDVIVSRLSNPEMENIKV
jgi:predicted ATPase